MLSLIILLIFLQVGYNICKISSNLMLGFFLGYLLTCLKTKRLDIQFAFISDTDSDKFTT